MGEAIFLDVMGRPPRGPSFSAARRASRRFGTDWGTLPTVGIRDLIELKKTQRLADYPVISALTLRLLEEATSPSDMLSWAARNLFTVETFFLFNEQHPGWAEMPPEGVPPPLAEVAGLAGGGYSRPCCGGGDRVDECRYGSSSTCGSATLAWYHRSAARTAEPRQADGRRRCSLGAARRRRGRNANVLPSRHSELNLWRLACAFFPASNPPASCTSGTTSV